MTEPEQRQDVEGTTGEDPLGERTVRAEPGGPEDRPSEENDAAPAKQL